MKKFFSSNDQVLPRPTECLPDYANARSRRALAEKLVAAFQLSEPAAEAFSNAVIDPSAVRKAIGEPDDPQVERIAVPGGKLLGIRTEAWARKITPDARNPRTLPSRRHPFAVDPGTAGEDSRFRPVAEPHTPAGVSDTAPELAVDIESRMHLEWASRQAADYVLGDNDWRDSIRVQGVMEAVWLAATTYVHEDGSAPVTVPVTVEGSSRITAVHDILGVRSADVAYEDSDAKLRTQYKRLNEAFERRTETVEQSEALRCERVPALLLVGFERNASSTAGFPTAVKSLVALRHVDPPKAWGEGPANEALSDEVLHEICRRSLISSTEREYYAGSITKGQAREAHLPEDPAIRAARIVGLFARADDAMGEAIRIAVTSQSTRRRITRKMCNELATALIGRSVALSGSKAEQVRRYLRNAFGAAVYTEVWEPTSRDTETLVKEAVKEITAALADESVTEPGPASLELAIRAAYPLIVSGSLSDDRGSLNNKTSDRRIVSEVLDRMRRTVEGARQLGQSLEDFGNDSPIRAVDEAGTIRQRPNGLGELFVNDVYLREQYPAPGKARGRSGGTMPSEQLKDKLVDLSEAFDKLEEAFNAVLGITGLDNGPLVADMGVDPEFCSTRRRLLSTVGDELHFWGRTYRQRHGVSSSPSLSDEDANAADEVDDDLVENEDAALA